MSNLPALKRPYYAVIFSSCRTSQGQQDYEKMAQRMETLAQAQPGFLGIESSRGSDGFGITVSYWEDLEKIKSWKAHSEHLIAQEFGRSQWYESFTTRICKVERDYDFEALSD